MSQDRKKELAPKIKDILKGYCLKGSLSVQHHSTLVLNITEGEIDFCKNFNETASERTRDAEGYIQVNHYWYHRHFSGIAKDVLKRLIDAMNIGNHNNSRPEIDYFDIGWYIDINIGKWNKPYKVVA